MKRATLLVAAVCCAAIAGCFEWTEDPKGNLQSVGLPGMPVWKSNKPPEPLTPAEAGFTPEEASKISGPVLVEPPTPTIKTYRYRYYQTSQNKCQDDLKKMLADRAASGATGPEPFCTDTPTAPPVKGNAFVF